jgi:hypothetical protein
MESINMCRAHMMYKRLSQTIVLNSKGGVSRETTHKKKRARVLFLLAQ